jgi:hypothetical protein
MSCSNSCRACRGLGRLHLHDHGDLLVHSLEKEHVVRPQLFEDAGAAVGEVAIGDNRDGPGREEEPRSSEEHNKELRLVAQDLDDGLVLETWHEFRMPPPTDILNYIAGRRSSAAIFGRGTLLPAFNKENGT